MRKRKVNIILRWQRGANRYNNGGLFSDKYMLRLIIGLSKT